MVVHSQLALHKLLVSMQQQVEVAKAPARSWPCPQVADQSQTPKPLLGGWTVRRARLGLAARNNACLPLVHTPLRPTSVGRLHKPMCCTLPSLYAREMRGGPSTSS